ncbi:MAG: hypothetical protein ABIQ17_01655 [Candidatus Limnocylindrales bacterium]
MQRHATKVPLLIALVGLVVSACGVGTPDLKDPDEILTKSVAAFEGADSVRLVAEVDGTLSLDLTRLGQATDMSLAGTMLTADLDLRNHSSHVSAAVPAFLGLSADIVVIGPDTWMKISLSGDKYDKSATDATSPTDPDAVIRSVTDFLARPEVRPTKNDDAACGSKSCYQVEIDLTAADLATLMPGTDLGDAIVVVKLLIEKDTHYPVSATVSVVGSGVGDLTLTLAMSDWNKSLIITAPPADQAN